MTTALVLGGAECIWSDLAAIEEMVGGSWPGPILACNDVATVVPDLDHFCTLHAEKLVKWERARADAGLPALYETWSCARRSHIDHCWDGGLPLNRRNGRTGTNWTHGSSGLYAVGVALVVLKCDRVVTCGIRMDEAKNAFRGKKWAAADRYLPAWRDRVEFLRPRMRSMSGPGSWTGATFGAPDRDWALGRFSWAA